LDSLVFVAHLARAVATLRVSDEHLVPGDVSVLLGCEPTKGWAKGETLTSQGVMRTARVGHWSLDAAETEPADLDAQVTAILSRLTTDEAVWAKLCADYHVDLFCGWFMQRGNEGVSIKPETMAALGSRGILLDIDLYSGDSKKSPD
jgi:Domain of unknown function (DUF4279)